MRITSGLAIIFLYLTCSPAYSMLNRWKERAELENGLVPPRKFTAKVLVESQRIKSQHKLTFSPKNLIGNIKKDYSCANSEETTMTVALDESGELYSLTINLAEKETVFQPRNNKDIRRFSAMAFIKVKDCKITEINFSRIFGPENSWARFLYSLIYQSEYCSFSA